MGYIVDIRGLKELDIILIDGERAGKNSTSFIIKKVMESSYSHVMVYCEGVVFEALKDGVQVNNLEHYWLEKKENIKVLRINREITDTEKRKIKYFLKSNIHQPYTTLGAAASAIKTGVKKEKFFCTRLLAKAFESVGIRIGGEKESDIVHIKDIERNKELLEEIEIDFIEIKEKKMLKRKKKNNREKKLLKIQKIINDHGVKKSVAQILYQRNTILEQNPELDQKILDFLEENNFLKKEEEVLIERNLPDLSKYPIDDQKYALIEYFYRQYNTLISVYSLACEMAISSKSQLYLSQDVILEAENVKREIKKIVEEGEKIGLFLKTEKLMNELEKDLRTYDGVSLMKELFIYFYPLIKNNKSRIKENFPEIYNEASTQLHFYRKGLNE